MPSKRDLIRTALKELGGRASARRIALQVRHFTPSTIAGVLNYEEDVEYHRAKQGEPGTWVMCNGANGGNGSEEP